MRLLAEFRRRNLFRVATFHVAASWLLVQVATQVLPFFGLPQSLLRWLVVALVCAFPFVMLFAWFFEWTTEGIKRESEVEPHASITHETGRKLDFWIMGVLSLVIVFLLVDAFVPRVDTDTATGKSIAVLPMTSVGGQGEELYFSDGLSEDLIIALSQSRDLRVISRNSSFRFRDSSSDSTTIGKQLGVAYLLQGNVRRGGSQVSVVVELVDTGDGATVWSQRYQRPYRDLFALQDDITDAVAAELHAELLADTGAAAAVVQSDRPPSGNLEAYNAYLQGKFYYERKSEADYRSAIEFYATATRLDPDYAVAHAGLAYAWTDLAGYYLGGTDARQAYDHARLAAATALRLDPELAQAHGARGLLLANADMDWAAAEAEYRSQLQLAPNDSTAQSSLGNMLAARGQLSQAIDLTRQSILTDPLHSAGYTALAAYLSPLGRVDEAEQAIQKAIELQPEAGWERVQLTILQIQRGDARAAMVALQEVHDEGGWLEIAQALVLQIGDDAAAADAALALLIETQADVSAFQIAEIYALRGQPDQTFEWLDRAWANRDPGLSRLWYDPFILRYKHAPRFAAFCRKVGLPVTGEGGEPAVRRIAAGQAVAMPGPT